MEKRNLRFHSYIVNRLIDLRDDISVIIQTH